MTCAGLTTRLDFMTCFDLTCFGLICFDMICFGLASALDVTPNAMFFNISACLPLSACSTAAQNASVSTSIAFQLAAMLRANSRKVATPCDLRCFRREPAAPRDGAHHPLGTLRWEKGGGRGGR